MLSYLGSAEEDCNPAGQADNLVTYGYSPFASARKYGITEKWWTQAKQNLEDALNGVKPMKGKRVKKSTTTTTTDEEGKRKEGKLMDRSQPILSQENESMELSSQPSSSQPSSQPSNSQPKPQTPQIKQTAPTTKVSTRKRKLIIASNTETKTTNKPSHHSHRQQEEKQKKYVKK